MPCAGRTLTVLQLAAFFACLAHDTTRSCKTQTHQMETPGGACSADPFANRSHYNAQNPTQPPVLGQTTQTLPSYTPRNSGGAPEQRAGKKRAGGRRVKAGGSRHERMVRKQMLGVTMIDVSKVLLDEEGLGKNWLGRALPGLTKEGVVRYDTWGRGAGGGRAVQSGRLEGRQRGGGGCVPMSCMAVVA